MNYLKINASKTQAMTKGLVPCRYNFSVDNNEVNADTVI